MSPIWGAPPLFYLMDPLPTLRTFPRSLVAALSDRRERLYFLARTAERAREPRHDARVARPCALDAESEVSRG